MGTGAPQLENVPPDETCEEDSIKQTISGQWQTDSPGANTTLYYSQFLKMHDEPAAMSPDDIYPGTEVMEDGSDTHVIHNQNNLAGVVLVPQPSANADDPLNWSPLWKYTVVALQMAFLLTSVISALSVSPLAPVFQAQFNKDADAVALLTSVLVIVTGYTNLVLVPIAEVYGRRFVLIASSLTCVGGSLWQGAATSYGSFMGARVLIAVGMSVGESLMPMVISDVFFLHERGRLMGVYFFALFNSMCLGPLIAGTCDAHFGTWRTFYWILAALSGASTVATVLFHPETKYARQPLSEVASGTTASFQGSEAPSPNEKTSATAIEQQEAVAVAVDQHLGRGRPSRSQFRLWQPRDTSLSVAGTVSLHVVTPFRVLLFPIVLFGAWMFAAAASGVLALNYSQSMALTVAPYNFSNMQVGLSNLALVCGGSLGVLTAGPLSDWVAMALTRRNHGVREPEMRLLSMIPFVALSAVALVVVADGLDRHWPWEAVIIVGFGGTGLMTVSLSTISITYAVDCYKPVAGQIMVIATVVKNTFGFGMGYYIVDWIIEDGYTPLFMCELGLIVGPAVLGLVFFYFFGKRLRKLSRHSKVHTY
ncbi:hypothetical protein SCUCBS95973_005431 [Sporothrix curviconia]|uniref:Major facilitator superfamily (MFS) profile domain-containing protein n=1 Tax=Sporothrix curviconia TaxID=1260050 RepID=A0ABP0BXS0_9PEZI